MSPEKKQASADAVLSTIVQATAETLGSDFETPIGVVIFAHDGKTCYANTNMSEAETLAIIEGMLTLWKPKS
jgi:hypothetical protein